MFKLGDTVKGLGYFGVVVAVYNDNRLKPVVVKFIHEIFNIEVSFTKDGKHDINDDIQELVLVEGLKFSSKLGIDYNNL